MDALEAEFRAFCAYGGYAIRPGDERLVHRAAAFAWLCLNPDEPEQLH